MYNGRIITYVIIRYIWTLYTASNNDGISNFAYIVVIVGYSLAFITMIIVIVMVVSISRSSPAWKLFYPDNYCTNLFIVLINIYFFSKKQTKI